MKYRLFEILGMILLSPFTLWFWIERQYWLRTKGFYASAEFRHGVKYEEIYNGLIKSLTLSGSMDNSEPEEIDVPSDEEWQNTMPDWAKWRKNEILQRVKIFLSPQKSEYREVKATKISV